MRDRSQSLCLSSVQRGAEPEEVETVRARSTPEDNSEQCPNPAGTYRFTLQEKKKRERANSLFVGNKGHCP